MSIIPSASAGEPRPVAELRAAVAKLRKHIKHATDSPWHTSSVWSPRATSTSAVYSHAHPAGTVESEVVASGRIRSGYGGIRQPWNAEYIALMQPSVGAALAEWLEAVTEEFAEAYHDVAEYPDDDPDEGPECVDDCDACSSIAHPLAIARLINGEGGAK
jgi:hypothetical protein